MKYYYKSPDHADYAIKVAFGCMVGAILIAGAVCVPIIIHSKNQQDNLLERLNAKIERDIDVNSFSTQNIIFDKTDENYVIKITGSSKESTYLAAKYSVSEQDFYDIKPSESDFVKMKDLRLNYKFLDNVLDILYRSEFLGKEAENLALINDGELVLNLSKPYVDKETNSVNYDLTILKLHNNDLKFGTFVVSTPLDEELKENPKTIYALSNEKIEIKKVDIKTYKNVFQVEIYDDSTLIV